jgi:predicted metal-dependent hydrolase
MVRQIVIGGVPIDVHFKDIKNLHLSVYPPTGRVRISAPEYMTIETVQLFATSKIGWIRKHQSKVLKQPRETAREYIERESHNFWGRRYLLHIIENAPRTEVVLGNRVIELSLARGVATDDRRAVLDEWYRRELRAKASPLLEKWSRRLEVSLSRFFIQRMKTKWGSSNPASRTVRLNLELAKFAPECLDYVALHELAHFVVPNHNERFRDILDANLPGWRHIRDRLNEGPLAAID